MRFNGMNGRAGKETMKVWRARWMQAIAAVCLFAGGAAASRGELTFDVFVGYDGTVREASWFPIACEIYNDGPSFNAVVEFSSASAGADQVRRIPIEVSSNTRKRFVIPMFSTASRFSWDARLLTENGKARKEVSGVQPRGLIWEAFLLGALPRTFAGMPEFPEYSGNPDARSTVARLPADQFPDNPIALEGLDALYLNSERALDLRLPQVSALLSWVHEGGHLIVSVEQLTDVTGTPWLRDLLPAVLEDVAAVDLTKALAAWVGDGRAGRLSAASYRWGDFSDNNRAARAGNPFSRVRPDPEFQGEAPVVKGAPRDGEALLSHEGTPVILEGDRGRGRVTLLTFNPEREPFRSWANREWFWAKVAGVPESALSSQPRSQYGGWSIDGVFGSLLDSRQVRSLPVAWLLLLLVVYLVVIGPLDQYWLKKINRQMLTWLTFPAYVVLFSLLIWLIGYKLRAGDTEWNELNIVDIVPARSGAELRGRTYISVYSSSNARYPVAADVEFGSLRGEYLDMFGGGRSGTAARVRQEGNTFAAEVFVPVWTSLIYVSDWVQAGEEMAEVKVSTEGSDWRVELANRLDRPLEDVRLAVGGRIYDLGRLDGREEKSVVLKRTEGDALARFVESNENRFSQAVQSRRNPLGASRESRLNDAALTATVASFAAHFRSRGSGQRTCSYPAGLDLSPLVGRGDAVLLALDPGHAPTPPLNRFEPPRISRDTFFRMAVPVNGARPTGDTVY